MIMQDKVDFKLLVTKPMLHRKWLTGDIKVTGIGASTPPDISGDYFSKEALQEMAKNMALVEDIELLLLKHNHLNPMARKFEEDGH